MEAENLRHLNAVLRVQLTAVQQHFVHVLTLRAWGDAETAEGIIAIDGTDLPNAMRIVDLIVADGAVPEPCGDHGSLARHMPTPGSSYDEIFAAEQRLEGKLMRILQSAEVALTRTGTREDAQLIRDALAPRERYARWLRRQRALRSWPKRSPQRLSGRAASSVDALFAHLMVVIEQGLIHSFVHWRSGRKKLADAAWSMSGAAMMHAKEITNHLALRHSAPSPARAVLAHSVQLPRIGQTPEQARDCDRAIAGRCREVAEQAEADAAGTEFAVICRDIAAYFQALTERQPGLEQPEIANPCRGFERVLRDYVWRKTDRMPV